MELANFKCEECYSEQNSLNVHHTYYSKHLKPWEYPNEALLCLCDECHKVRHYVEDAIKSELGMVSTIHLVIVKHLIATLHDYGDYAPNYWGEECEKALKSIYKSSTDVKHVMRCTVNHLMHLLKLESEKEKENRISEEARKVTNG